MRFTRVLPLPLAAVATAVTALALSTVAQAAPEKLDLDPAHTHVGFSIRHIFTPVRGEFQKVKGTIELDRDNLNASKVTVDIDPASISTNNAHRDDDLRSENFFDVAKNPTMSFIAKTIAVKDGKGTMTGDLTMHGVTKPVTLDVEVLGISPVGAKQTVAGFTASGKIDRKDWGLTWNRTLDNGGTLLSDDVTLEIDVEARTPRPPGPPPGQMPPPGQAPPAGQTPPPATGGK